MHGANLDRVDIKDVRLLMLEVAIHRTWAPRPPPFKCRVLILRGSAGIMFYRHDLVSLLAGKPRRRRRPACVEVEVNDLSPFLASTGSKQLQ